MRIRDRPPINRNMLPIAIKIRVSIDLNVCKEITASNMNSMANIDMVMSSLSFMEEDTFEETIEAEMAKIGMTFSQLWVTVVDIVDLYMHRVWWTK